MTEDFNPPTVTIVSPAKGTTLFGLVSVTAKAWDDVGVVNVTFQANGIFIGTAHHSPFKILWNTTRTPNGPVRLTAYSYDRASNQSLPSLVEVNVNNRHDDSPPVATVLSPADGSTVTGIVTIRGEAVDNIAVTRIIITVDGEELCSLANANRISHKWDTRDAEPGRHVISIIAEDASGNIGAASVNVEK
ncbi:MAG: Ig-like domain-containing protein [Bdellovibrionales bacterium]